MKRVLLWAFIALGGVVPAFSQWATRTVTNADLEVYKQERLRAERDYAQNYDKMGFPSPEELKQQLEKARVEREALSARLAAERIGLEKSEAERAAAEAQANPGPMVFVIPNESRGYPNYGGRYGYFGWGLGDIFGNRYRYRSPGRFRWPSRVGAGIPYFNYIRPR